MPNVRRAVARLGRGRSFRRRLPADLGGAWFPASLEGGVKFLKRDVHAMDPMLTRFAKDYIQPGAVIWDIGANVGLFTFAAAGLAGPTGHVVAVEADTWLAGNLRRAAGWNRDLARVSVIPVAASDNVGVAAFKIGVANRAVNHLASVSGSTVTGGTREVQYVPTLTLDEILEEFPAPQILKIDVEGAEIPVLRGATKVLGSRPTLLLEVGAQQAAEVNRLLKKLGYVYVDAITRQSVDLPTANIIASAGR